MSELRQGSTAETSESPKRAVGRPRKEGGVLQPEGYVKSGSEYVHRTVARRKYPEDEQECYWCLNPIIWLEKGEHELIVDHVDHNRRNNRPDNLVPACRRCNLRRRPGVEVAPGGWAS